MIMTMAVVVVVTMVLARRRQRQLCGGQRADPKGVSECVGAEAPFGCRALASSAVCP
jgi:hypothetical protein